jgi:hypothetical protein
MPVHDLFEFLVLGAIVRLSVAEGRDNKRNAVLGGGIHGRIPDVMYKLPESGSAEVEDRPRQIDGRVIVEQSPRYHSKQRFRDREFAGCGRAVEEDQFHD